MSAVNDGCETNGKGEMNRVTAAAGVLIMGAVLTLGAGGCLSYAPVEYGNTSPAGLSGDEALRSEIVARLENDSMADRARVSVEVRGGVVTLRGTVSDDIIRTRVLGIVMGTPGVQEVDDRLTTLR